MKAITIWAVTKSASFQREGEGVWGNQHDRFKRIIEYKGAGTGTQRSPSTKYLLSRWAN